MRILLATGNAHKIEEVAAILAGIGVSARVLSPSVVGGMPDVAENAGTFEGNAAIKARALYAQIVAHAEAAVRAGDWLALADDSGLCVDALDGAPGVNSARFAGEGGRGADETNTAKLLRVLGGLPPQRRTAAFRCCLVAIGPDGVEHVFDGRCPGHIIDAPCGGGGFGYDPVFVPEGHADTFAELPAEVKNRISHRARALALLASWLRGRA